MGKYFGTDGFRGEAGLTLTSDHAYKVAASLAGIMAFCAKETAIQRLRAL